MKIMDDFRWEWELALFIVSKDEWDTKEGTGKSKKNVLHVQAKGTSWAEAMSSNEKFKPIALATVELHQSDGIS